ncbi:hypothetical protein P43SY_001736 [Pythium insidiosum]|uniref:DUF2428 domain-containing protein n=1 Tax=Pythium insidiosum TaxID=114742 RepID=A0AAD5LCH6_PYTIN|nr:hypothetical protein P43SY_001736 [Pythium insidiosum]
MATTSPPPQDDDDALRREIEALDRVLFRLASISDDARFLQVLESLLPQLLCLFPTALASPTAAELRDKILQVIAHVRTRLQAIAAPTLPVAALAELLSDHERSVYTRNFASLFIEMGFSSLPRDRQISVLATVVASLRRASSAQQDACFRMLLSALPLSGAEARALGCERGAAVVLSDFLLDVVLYTGTASATPPHGLMAQRLERLQRAKVSELRREQLYERQLHVLQLVKAMAASSSDHGHGHGHACLHYVAGAASHHHAIKSLCDDLLQRVVKGELHPESPLEDATFCRQLMVFMLGSLSQQRSAVASALEGADAILLGDRARAADASLLAAIGLLSASKASANVLPQMLQVVCQLMFGQETGRPPNVAQRIKIAGVKLAQWVLHQADSQLLASLYAPVLLPTFLRVLMDTPADETPSDAAFAAEFRLGIYESVSVLSARAPAILAASAQAFQVVLARCLVESAGGLPTAANAGKTLAALQAAYASHASEAVLGQIEAELIGLLRGAKLFDPRSRYERVRCAVADWAGRLLACRQSTTLRFALFRLSADPDEAVRESARAAIYREPLPTVAELAASLAAAYPTRDLKTQLDPLVAKTYIEFAHALVNKATARGLDAPLAGTLEYFVETLSYSTQLPAAPDVRSLLEAIASSLVELLEAHGDAIAVALGDRVEKIVAAAYAGHDRRFLLNMARLLEASFARLEPSAQASIARRLVHRSLASFADASKLVGHATASFCSSAYLLGSAVSRVDALSSSEALGPLEADALAAQALETVVKVLVSRVATVSNTTAIPRGEDAQNKLLDELRSCCDAMALSGSWNALLKPAQGATPDALRAHRVAALDALCVVLRWKLTELSADGSLKQKLLAMKQVALETIASLLAGSVVYDAVIAEANDRVLAAVLALGSQPLAAEMQVTVGQTLVALGEVQNRIGQQPTDHNSDGATATRLLTRILHECVGSSSPVLRRSACIWLLTICAAGLGPSRATAVGSAWRQLFHAESAFPLLTQLHDFFVSMLSDAQAIAKESAVKGLAYLRLRAPSKELGDQFSDALFRRLRCYRAFTSTADSTTRQASQPLGDDGDNNPSDAPEDGATAASAGDTVSNIAYREVSNVAADIGDPELVYSLLYLSTTDPIWSALAAPPPHVSSRFSFPKADREFRAQLIANANSEWANNGFEHGDKLLSWLFLLKHHGNSKVAEIMTGLWGVASGQLALSAVAGSERDRSVVDDRRDVLMAFLLSKIETSRNFKYREAGCLALTALLAGADAEQVNGQFTRLWKAAARSVDDVTEAVAAVALKLFRALGELSLRVAARDAQCRRELVDFLVLEGMVSKNAVCRALSIDLILRVVKDVDADALRGRLAGLILKCLEYLSSLEIPELQYAQFHVDKKDQLERLRVSLSQSGPVGQLLEQCTTQLKALAVAEINAAAAPAPGADAVSIVDDVSRGVVSILKFGVGLNTRVGTANFVATLATELSFELRKCKGADLILAKALLPYVRERSAAENLVYGDDEDRYAADGSGVQDALVLQSYCRAAAYLCPLAEPSLVRTFVRDGIFACAQGASPQEQPDTVELVDSSRFLLVSALAAKELVNKCPPTVDASALASVDNRSEWYCGCIFPAAFIGQFAEATALKAAWTDVLQALPPTVSHAEASLDASLAAIGRLIRHPAWGTRKQAVRALQALFVPGSVFRQRISSERTDQIWRELLAAIPGRLWRGKGAVLEALVTVAAVRDAEAFAALSDLLVSECDRAWKNQDTEYLESSLLALAALSSTARPGDAVTRERRVRLFSELQSRVEAWPQLPPMLIKALFETLAALWPESCSTDDSEAAARSTHAALQWLCRAAAQPALHVWSVRRAVFDTTAAVVAGAPRAPLLNTQLVTALLERCTGELGVRDGRYSMVRVSAAGVLDALLGRGLGLRELELVLVVNRERLESAVATLRRSDEPAEQQAAARVAARLQSPVQ